MIQRGHRSDPGADQLLAQPAVEVDAGLVDPSRALGEDPGPGDREAVRVYPELGHQRHVVGEAVIVVDRLVAVVSVVCEARGVAEGVPDRWAAPVFGDGALHLIGGGGHPPQEAGWELR